MKKITILLLFITATAAVLRAQTSIKDKSVTFFGLDFSKCRMIGSDGFSNPADIVNRIFGEWNNLIVNEKTKYDVEFAFNKTEVKYSFDIVSRRNLSVNPGELVTNNTYSFDDKTVASVIKSYAVKEKGLGIVLVVEKFDKTEELATVFVTYFDMGSKKVLLSERVSAKPVGFGFRNYWAGAIAKILKDCHNKTPGWEAKAN